jgi:hypothetical protein
MSRRKCSCGRTWDDPRGHTRACRVGVSNRITGYLSGGGLFNPELADHAAVRNLLIDARNALSAPPLSE